MKASTGTPATDAAGATKGDTPELQLTDRQRQLAIQFGAQARSRLGRGAEWSDAEPALRAGWAALAATTQLSWEQARATVQAGWNLRASHQQP